MLDSLSFNAKQYGLPNDLGPHVLVYNKELFDMVAVRQPGGSA